MQQQNSGSKNILIFGVIFIVIAVVAVVVIISLSSQPSLPPAITTPSTTQTPTTPTIPADQTDTSSDSETDQDTVPTQGGVSDGVITNICGGSSDEEGIGTASGTCGRCVNLEGTDGYCEVETGEEIRVYGCDKKTGVRCSEKEKARTLDKGIEEKTYVSDYSDQACTIQIEVIDPTATTEADEIVDFIVFQNDECEESDTSDDSSTVQDAGTQSQCGDICIDDTDCPQDNICDNTGVCVLESCFEDPNKCVENDFCTLIELPGPITEDIVPCGGACQVDQDCAAAHVCINGKCTANECLTASAVGCVEGCPVTKCGDPCQVLTDCPVDHSCLQGKCVANFCIGEAGKMKCEDGCSLPKTALISDEADLVLFAIIIIIAGIFIYKTNFHVELFYALGGRYITAEFSDNEKDKLDKEIEKINKIRKKQKLEESKKTRESFEKSVLGD